MSRPPKATSILEVTGAFDKNPDRRRVGEPTPPDEMPVRPKYLKGKAARIFDRVMPVLYGMGTCKAIDADELASWCLMQAEFEDNFKVLSKIAAFMNAKRAQAEKFGMAGASSRAKLGIDRGKEKEQDPADKYLNGPTIGPGNSLRQ